MKRFVCIILIMIMLVGCSAPKQRFSAINIECFDTVTQIIAYTETKEQFDTLEKLVFSELERYHKLFDAYNSYDGINNIKTINDNAGVAPVKVEKDLFEMLEFSKNIYTATNGKTNVALGSVLYLWHRHRTDGTSVPDIDTLKELNEHTNIENLILDKENMTVFFADPEMRIDVGATAKGFAADRIADLVRESGVTSAAISLGGNVTTVGTRADGSAWSIGIQDPQNPDGTVMSTKLSDISLVTSGDYQRFYHVDGKKYHHIIDPETLMPAEYFSSVSIVCPSSALGDALSTALFCMSYEDGLEIIESLENTEALWITPDGKSFTSSGFEEAIA